MNTILVSLLLLFASTLVTTRGQEQQQEQQQHDLRNLSQASVIDWTTYVYNEPSDCIEWTNKINEMNTMDDIRHYISYGLERQGVVHLIWKCLGENNVTQRLPTTIYPTTEFVYGDGVGYLFPIKRIPYWNIIQPFIGSIFWGGKLFQNRNITTNSNSTTSNSTNSTTATDGDGGSIGQIPILKNLMDLQNTMSFQADAYESNSMVDNKHCIQLDYRKDTSRFASILVHNVRDEMREIIWRNISTEIYFGRANYFIRRSKLRYNSYFWNKNYNFILPASFLLDFRQEKQSLIPSWASAYYP